jgi:hypothetical protein
MRRQSSFRHAKRRRRLWVVSGGLAVIALIALAGAAMLRGRVLASALVGTLLDQAGLAPYSLDLRAIGFGGMRFGAVAAGKNGELSASSVAIDWSPWSLMHRRLARVSIADLRLTLLFDHGELRVEGLAQGRTASTGFALPVETLALTNAHITFSSSAGKVTSAVDATLSQGDQRITGEMAFDAIVTPSESPAIHIVGSLPEWSVSPAELRVAGGVLTLPERGTRLSDLTVRAFVTGAAESFNVSGNLSGELSDQSKPAAWVPLALALEARSNQTGIALTGSAKTPDNALVLTITGQHDFASGGGSIAIRSNPIEFARDGRQPMELFPIVGESLKHLNGALTASGNLSWGSGRRLASAAILTLDGIDFDAGAAAIANLRGNIALDSLAPLRTPKSQCVTATLQIVALPSGPLDLCFRLAAGNRLLIDRAALGFAEGNLSLAGISFVPAAPLDTVLTVHDVDLAALLSLLNIDGLSGSGALTGSIPIHLDPSGMAIAGGRLAAMGPGILRYVGAGLPSGIAAEEGSASNAVKLLRDAIADFHYTSLTLTLDRSADGQGSLLANIKGVNPAVLNGRLFALNIRFDANFDRLAAILLGGYAAGEELLRRSAGQ